MQSVKSRHPYICTSCAKRLWQNHDSYSLPTGLRQHSQTASQDEAPTEKNEHYENSSAGLGAKPEKGAMSRRLEDMTEDSVRAGGRGARKSMEAAGFSEELKEALLAKLEDGQFRSEHPSAFAEIAMPASAGRQTRQTAASQPWTEIESLEDAALRMLNDAHKPLRSVGPGRGVKPRAPPLSLDMRMKKAVQRSQGQRLANARDRTSVYALSQDPSMTEREREQMRKQLKERFTPGARPMPTTLQGLTSLANERIEDAIARGQFKNIPRGKGTNIERDYNASSPFLDTTEYFMNKIIQKQEIVPPWIEKQQELVRSAGVFRARLRNDWKRHAARVISSKGGSLEAQIGRAKAYAIAEAYHNSKATKIEALSTPDQQGSVATIIVEESTSKPSLPSTEVSESKITVTETLSRVQAPAPAPPSPTPIEETPSHFTPLSTGSIVIAEEHESTSSPTLADTSPNPASLPIFRDAAWEDLERSYQTLAVTDLNNLTRSYNLMAPDLAKKPYFSLARELRSCFADVAAQLADEISQRARTPKKVSVELIGHRPGGLLESFGTQRARVYDSRKPNYGFKEFWRDLWGGNKGEYGM